MQKPDRDTPKKTNKRPKTGGGALLRVAFWSLSGLILLLLLAIVFRVTLAEMAVRRFCSMNDIYCQIDIAALTPSRMSAADIRITDDQGADIASLASVDVELTWRGFFQPAPQRIAADGVHMTLDLTRGREAFERLRELAPTGDPQATPPVVSIQDAHVHLLTPAGNIDIDAMVDFKSPTDLTIAFDAQPTLLALNDSRLDFAGGRGQFQVGEDDTVGEATVQLSVLESPEGEIKGLHADLKVTRVQGALELQSQFQAERFKTATADVVNADAVLSATLGRPAFPVISTRSLLNAISDVNLEGRSDAGSWEGHDWRAVSFEASAARPMDGESAVGGFRLRMDDYDISRAFLAKTVELSGQVELPWSRKSALLIVDDGRLGVTHAALAQDSPVRELLVQAADAVPIPLSDEVSGTKEVLFTTIDDFSLSAPFEAEISASKTMRLASAGPISGKSESAAVLSLTNPDAPALVWESDEGLTVAGDLDVIATPLNLAARGVSANVIEGAFELEQLTASIYEQGAKASLTLDQASFQNAPTPQFDISQVKAVYSGNAYGAQWDEASVSGAVSGEKSDDVWNIDTPDGLKIALNGLSTNQTRLTAIASHYSPDGPLLKTDPAGARGRGRLGGVEARLTVGSRFYDIAFNEAGIDWTLEKALSVDLDLGDASFSFPIGGDWLRLEAPQASAHINADAHWRSVGRFSEAVGGYGPIEFDDVAAKFSIEGGEQGLFGLMTPLEARVKDIESPARFVATDFSGSLDLSQGEIKGQGAFDHPVLHQTLARISFEHDLKTGRGNADLTSTLLQFAPNGLQPAMIFPILRGIIANVEGPVVLTGGAQWRGGQLSTKAAMELTDLSFASEKAGLFEGVFGRVELTDVLKATSEPGQTIAIHEWNPGVPIKDGLVAFRLNGLDEVDVESVHFPFAGGQLTAQPVVWKVHADQNNVVVDATDVDLDTLLKKFGMSSFNAEGRLSGAVPVMFSTGSVTIENARLESRDGWFGYTGDPPENLDKSNQTLRLFFDALKDFSYETLDVQISGDVAGDMALTMMLEGHNPAVLDGYPFALKMELDADLMSLFNRSTLAERAVNEIRNALADIGRQENGAQSVQGARESRPPTGETR